MKTLTLTKLDTYYNAVLMISNSSWIKAYPDKLINKEEIIKAKRYVKLRKRIKLLRENGVSTRLLEKRLIDGYYL